MSSKFPFVLSKSQRGALIILLMGVLFLLTIQLTFQDNVSVDFDLAETNRYQQKLDSLRDHQPVAKVPSFRYNPNHLTDYQAYSIGISPQAFDRIERYRSEGNYFRSLAEFQKQSGVSDSLLTHLAPVLRFPQFKSSSQKNTPLVKQDLNTVDAAALQIVSGIGPTLSKRIVSYRNYLSGYSVPEQCYEVYGLDSATVKRLLTYFELKTPAQINRLNINTASLDQLTKLPYLGKEDARQIVTYRTRNQGITLAFLSELFADSPNKIERIKLYLY